MKKLALCLLMLGVLLLSIPAAAQMDGAADALMDTVTLSQTEITWETYRYAVDEDYSVVPGSYDNHETMTHTFTAWVIENAYLKVTVVPEFGGRVISMIYKPTGHEELYQNPIGAPYLMGDDIFYHDWLMVWGGIFPTFPEPEHGKTWLMPWDFEIITETPEAVTVAMTRTDDMENPNAPPQYDVGITDLRVTFYVTLRAGRAVLETRERIENPNDGERSFEYWTNTGLAPGSTPGESRVTAGAEIIAPVDRIRMPPWWPDLLLQEQVREGWNVYTFDRLRDFENWVDEGIAYAYPNLGEANFWGVINHDNREGIFRVADNSITQGLKIWTFGYDSVRVDPAESGSDWRRPFIELWAGITPEFWQRGTLEGGGEIVIDALYSPSVGLDGLTHANDQFLVNLALDDDDTAHLQIHTMEPGQEYRVTMTMDDSVLADEFLTPDPRTGSELTVSLSEALTIGRLGFIIETRDGDVLFQGYTETLLEGFAG